MFRRRKKSKKIYIVIIYVVVVVSIFPFLRSFFSFSPFSALGLRDESVRRGIKIDDDVAFLLPLFLPGSSFFPTPTE